MWIEILLFFAACFLLLYRYITKSFGRWEKEGIPTLSGTFPYGSHVEALTQSRHMMDVFREDYEKLKDHPVAGAYILGKPVLYINDMELIKTIMVKDFNYFMDRDDSNTSNAMAGGDIDHYWQQQMTTLSGEVWKEVRSTFTPIFTSGKMKAMMQFITEVGNSMVKELDRLADAQEDFEFKSVTGKFSLDSIATCAFGFNPNSYEDKTNSFVNNAAALFQSDTMFDILFLTRLVPLGSWIHKKLGFNLMRPKQTMFFVDIIRQAIKHRRESGERRNDMIDIMLDCMKNLEESNGKKKMDEDNLIATAFVLLVAGYDTTGMTLSYLAFYLSTHPEVQAKAQAEIDEAFAENDGKLPDYNTILGLPYLDMCVQETLRFVTPIGGISRACSKPYTIPGTNIHLKADDVVVIPASGIHMDPNYYPNPEKFNPENFSKEAKASRSPYAFQAFGQGPRGCIGMRFALLEIKMAACEILNRFTILPSTKTPEKQTHDPSHDLGYYLGGVWGKVQRR